jgi:hypothetical protein
MRVPRKACKVILGNVVTEVIEQKEWIEIRGVAKAKRAAEMNARTFQGWLGSDETFDRPNGHF